MTLLGPSPKVPFHYQPPAHDEFKCWKCDYRLASGSAGLCPDCRACLKYDLPPDHHRIPERTQ